MKHILAAIYGLIFGVANIIPGVSGGTMLVVCGCFDKVCGAFSLNFKEIKKNIVFLIFFGIGAAAGIVGFSFVVTYLFDNYPIPTYTFFMGLIIGSIPLIYKNATLKDKIKPLCIAPFILAAAAVIGLTLLNSSYSDKSCLIDSTQTSTTSTVTFKNASGKDFKSWSIDVTVDGTIASCEGATLSPKYSTVDKLLSKLTGSEPKAKAGEYTISPNDENAFIRADGEITFTLTGTWNGTPEYDGNYAFSMDAVFFLTLLAATAVAAIAMIIPGVSGSFVMMLLGVYATVIAAIKDFDFMILLPVFIGVIFGLIFGARLISYLMKKFRLMVFSVIMGLVIGSLYAILPQGVGLNAQTFIGAATLAVGAVISFIIGRNTKVEDEESAT